MLQPDGRLVADNLVRLWHEVEKSCGAAVPSAAGGAAEGLGAAQFRLPLTVRWCVRAFPWPSREVARIRVEKVE
jgi:hypothetical protein